MSYEVSTLTLENKNNANSNLIQIILDNETNCKIEFTDYIKLDLDELKNIVKQCEKFIYNYEIIEDSIEDNSNYFVFINPNLQYPIAKYKAIQFNNNKISVDEIIKEFFYNIEHTYRWKPGEEEVIFYEFKEATIIKINDWIIKTHDDKFKIYSDGAFKQLYTQV